MAKTTVYTKIYTYNLITSVILKFGLLHLNRLDSARALGSRSRLNIVQAAVLVEAL